MMSDGTTSSPLENDRNLKVITIFARRNKIVFG
jgi:hypothetical protein